MNPHRWFKTRLELLAEIDELIPIAGRVDQAEHENARLAAMCDVNASLIAELREQLRTTEAERDEARDERDRARACAAYYFEYDAHASEGK